MLAHDSPAGLFFPDADFSLRLNCLVETETPARVGFRFLSLLLPGLIGGTGLNEAEESG